MTADTASIDAHAHVWDAGCAIIPGARYRPEYTAPIETYLRVLDRHRIERAVLVQPSFLGTDNRYLLGALRAYPDRLRGIVVVEAECGTETLGAMAETGVIGVRHNLIGRDKAILAEPSIRALNHRIAALGLWIEVQAPGPHWPAVLQALPGESRVMVDHYALPSGLACPAFAAVSGAPVAQIAVKLSARYRAAPVDTVAVARRWIEAVGPERCLWGSDWPWTQHEGRHDYAETLSWLAAEATQAERQAMRAASGALCGFTATPA